MAVALTVGAIALAVAVGVTGPRLRERHGSTQQELPLAEAAAAAARHQAQSAFDVQHGRSRAAALDRMDALAADTLGRPVPDLSEAGLAADDARIVELAPDVHALMVIYRGGGQVASVAMLPDDGRMVRFDGLGRALPLPPGDEWAEVLDDDRGEPVLAAWAQGDGRVMHLVIAPDLALLRRIAPLAVR